MEHRCPHGHLAVVRNDPQGTGLIGQCDTCGWTAPYAVSREDQSYRHGDDEQVREQLERAQEKERESRKQIASPARR